MMTWKALQATISHLVLEFFSWRSKKQDVIAQSTAEAEYVAAVTAANQAIWLRKLMVDLCMEQKESTQVIVDNQAAISISKNPVFHGKTKHFKIKLYFLREVQKQGDVQLLYCKTENQLADFLTKSLPQARFEYLRQKLGVCCRWVKEEIVGILWLQQHVTEGVKSVK